MNTVHGPILNIVNYIRYGNTRVFFGYTWCGEIKATNKTTETTEIT